MDGAKPHFRFLLLLTVAGLLTAIPSSPQTSNVSEAAAPNLQPNPFDSQLAFLQNRFEQSASAPQAAILLRRIYELRELISDRRALAQWILKVSLDERQHRLVRHQALRDAALIDAHNGKIEAAQNKLRALGVTPPWLAKTPAAGPGMAEPAVEKRPATSDLELLAMAKRATKADPRNAEKLETLGLLERDSALVSALEHLQAAAWLQPSAEHWMAVAGACGEAACKFSALSAALKSDPENGAAKTALARYYLGRGQLEKARELLVSALKVDPGNFVARKRLAEVYASAGMDALALAELRRIEKESPNPLWVKRELATKYFELGLLDQARGLAQSALSENFDGSEDRDLLVRILERQRDPASLLAAYGEMARLNPADSFAASRIAALKAEPVELRTAEKGLDAAWGIADPDPDSEYLVNPEEQAAAVRRTAPSVAGNVIALAEIRVQRVYASGLNSVREQQLFYIGSTGAAREYSKRIVQYTPGAQEIKVLHARIHKHDGRVLEAEEAGEEPVADASIAMYYDVRSRVVRFPRLEKGDVVELDYRISPVSQANPYGDYFGELVAFQSAIPEKLQRYVLITPAARAFNILEQRMPAPARVIVKSGERIYRWEATDIAPLANEPREPALTEVAPYVHVSTFASWEQVGRWYAQLIQPQFALDSALRDALAELLAGRRTEMEKIRAIHQFVLRNTHYVALEFGIYGYKPYPVSQTYARRFGDCKDKASLMIALLRAAGIESEIALVRTRRLGNIAERAVSISLFNHAVVYVPRYDLWLDGTAEYAGSHELPLDDQGAIALTVSAEGAARLRRIPVTSPLENYTRRSVRAQIAPTGEIQFSGSAFTRGEDAPGLRREYETLERQRDFLRDRLAEIFPSVRVEDVNVQGATDLENDVSVNFRGTLDTFSGQRTFFLAGSWMPRIYVQTLAPLASRTQDLVLPAPWTTEEELHFALPAGASVRSLPQDKSLETAFGSASMHYEWRGRELVVRTTVQFRKLRITPAEYASFREFCGSIERAFRAEIKVQLGG